MSYIEMLVALSIVTLVLIVAGAMLVQMSRQAESQGLRQQAVGGVTDLALDRIEQDLREALHVRDGVDEGGARELVIDAPGGDRIRWKIDGGNLTRRREISLDATFDRVVATEVSLAEWRPRSTHLFDVLLRRTGETLRQRTVLLRNLDRGGLAEEP
jgi:hypothetical protein